MFGMGAGVMLLAVVVILVVLALIVLAAVWAVHAYGTGRIPGAQSRRDEQP